MCAGTKAFSARDLAVRGGTCSTSSLVCPYQRPRQYPLPASPSTASPLHLLLLRPAGFGVPNRRRRVFIVASLYGDPRDVLLAQVGMPFGRCGTSLAALWGCGAGGRCCAASAGVVALLLTGGAPWSCRQVVQLQCTLPTPTTPVLPQRGKQPAPCTAPECAAPCLPASGPVAMLGRVPAGGAAGRGARPLLGVLRVP